MSPVKNFGKLIGSLSLVGFNAFSFIGMGNEHERINNFAYKQAEISNFDKNILSIDYHCRAGFVYGTSFLMYTFLFPFQSKSYLEIVNGFRNSHCGMLVKSMEHEEKY